MIKFYPLLIFFVVTFFSLTKARANSVPLIEEGFTCENAHVSVEGNNILPARESYGSTWFSFVMPQNGRISVYSPYSNSINIYKGGCTELEDITFLNAYASNLVAGETYFIELYGRGLEAPQEWSVAIEDDKAGDLCTLAYDAQLGANVEPEGTVSHFWYKFLMPEDGNLLISNDYRMEVEIFRRGCDDLDKITEGNGPDGTLAVGLTGGETYFLKCSAWGKPVVWLFEVNETEPGQICSKAIEPVEGENMVPETQSPFYWYKVSLQEDGKIKIRFQNGGGFTVYKGSCDNLTETGASEISQGTLSTPITYFSEIAEGIYEVEGSAGEEFYFKFNTSDGGNFIWTLTEEPKGGTCETAATSGEGINNIPVTDFNTYWYSFTMPFDGRLNLTNPDGRQIFIYEGNCSALIEKTSGNGNLSLSDLSKNNTYYIQTDASPTQPGEFVVSLRQTQTITFGEISPQLFSSGSYTLSATTTSGLAVIFEVTAGSATVSGNTLSFTTSGEVTVTARQEGNAAYLAAEPVSQAFCVSPDKPMIAAENGAELKPGVRLVSESPTGNQWFRGGVKIEVR